MENTAYQITKALGFTENGGKPDINNRKAGKTGETASIFQYTPDTWKNYAQQITGNPDLPMTPDNEVEVTTKKVEQWLKQGLTPQQIFSSWNAGAGEPNAYTGTFSNGKPSVGINEKYGVKYDVPGYVNKAMSYLDGFSDEGNSKKEDQQQKPQLAEANPQTPPSPPNPSSPSNLSQGLISSLLPKLS